MRRTGRCECGAVRFEAETEDCAGAVCHCSQCRRWSGYLWAAISAPEAGLRIEGGPSLKWRRSSDKAERGFCAECGSSLFWREVGAGSVDLALGALDDASGIELKADIWVDGAPELFGPTPGRPRYQTDRSGPLADD